jgi:hypothetical protein
MVIFGWMKPTTVVKGSQRSEVCDTIEHLFIRNHTATQVVKVYYSRGAHTE